MEEFIISLPRPLYCPTNISNLWMSLQKARRLFGSVNLQISPEVEKYSYSESFLNLLMILNLLSKSTLRNLYLLVAIKYILYIYIYILYI